MQRDSIQNTFRVAILLCLVCSVMVSVTAVGLRDTQQAQKERFRQENILKAAGLWEPGLKAESVFREQIHTVVVDLETDKSTDRFAAGAKELDVKSAIRDRNLSRAVDGSDETGTDLASIVRRETYATIYEVREDGRTKTLVLPIRGYGLWSTLWGFIAIDFSTADPAHPSSLKVKGLTYFQHAETPGLGGEVDNELWKAKWPGRQIFEDDWSVALEVSKTPSKDSQVDAISGATLTSNGVTNMLKYWLGPNGFGPYVQSVLAKNASAPASQPESETSIPKGER